MNGDLQNLLRGFTNIQTHITRGITHTQIRVMGDGLNIQNPGFIADVYINRRTQQASIARIDSGDTLTLYTILGVISRFQF
jgi:hypothetical protein